MSVALMLVYSQNNLNVKTQQFSRLVVHLKVDILSDRIYVGLFSRQHQALVPKQAIESFELKSLPRQSSPPIAFVVTLLS